MNCNYKVRIKDIQNKYQFKIFCKTYDDTEIQGDIETLNSEVEALQEENLYLNNLVEQAFDKKEVEGEELSIDDTVNAKMEVGLEGNTTQKTTTGKNKLVYPYNETTKTQNGITFTDNGDGSITINGTSTNAAYFNFRANTTEDRQILNPGTYTISVNQTLPNGVNISIGFRDSEGNPISGLSTATLSTNTRTITVTTNQMVEVFGFISINSGTAISNYIAKVLLEPGSTASSYEKYTGGIASPNPSYPSNVNVVTGDNTIVVSNKNFISVQPTPYNATAQYSPLFSTDIIANLKKGKTYTLSFDTENTGINCYFQQTTGISLTYKAFTCDGTRKYVTFTTTQDLTTISKVIVSRNSATSTTGTGNCTNVMIEQGSTATSYVQHQEQTFQINLGNIELCKIGDYRDYFYKSNNKWYKHSEIGKVVLDGSETWFGGNSASVSTDYTYLFSPVLDNLVKSGYFKAYCNKFYNLNNTMQGTTQVNTDTIAVGDTTSYKVRIMILTSRLATQSSAGFKTWLSNNNTTIYYVLATPTNTEITDTTLISQLEALKTAMSYAGQTNISQINDDVPFILQVKALASYNSRIVALEQAILNANRNVSVENSLRKVSSNEVIEEPKEEVVDDNKDKNIIKEEK